MRARVHAGMTQYNKGLRSGHTHQVGDSIVRQCHVLDNKTLVLEQQLTVYLHIMKSGWLGKALAHTDQVSELTCSTNFSVGLERRRQKPA